MNVIKENKQQNLKVKTSKSLQSKLYKSRAIKLWDLLRCIYYCPSAHALWRPPQMIMGFRKNHRYAV